MTDAERKLLETTRETLLTMIEANKKSLNALQEQLDKIEGLLKGEKE